MSRERWIELLSAGPLISEKEYQALLRFRPQPNILALSVRQALFSWPRA